MAEKQEDQKAAGAVKLPVDRIYGGLWALITGDALGVPVEFQPRSKLDQNPVTGMRAFGSHDQKAGTWSDDSSMMLAAMDTLCTGYNPEEIMRHFDLWMTDHQYTPWGEVFDIGGTCRTAIRRWDLYNLPAVKCGLTDKTSNGNGSLMWILPLCCYAAVQERTGKMTLSGCVSMIMEASGMTHAHPISKIGCGLYFFMIRQLLWRKETDTLAGVLESALAEGFAFFDRMAEEEGNVPEQEPDDPQSRLWAWQKKADGTFSDALAAYDRLRDLHAFAAFPREEIKSTGYVVYTLEAAVWCALRTDSLKEALLAAANLGDDTDTVAAVTGGISGTWYGFDAIPEEWLSILARREWIDGLCRKFVESLEQSES